MNNVYKIYITNENIVATPRRHNPIPISAFLLQEEILWIFVTIIDIFIIYFEFYITVDTMVFDDIMEIRKPYFDVDLALLLLDELL